MFDKVILNKERTYLQVDIIFDSRGKEKYKRPFIQIPKNIGDYSPNDLIKIYISNVYTFENSYTGNISKKEIQKIIDFLSEHKNIILSHWNKEIDDLEILQKINGR